jgi:hypothetical protein
MKTVVLSLSAIALLTACGGSSTGGGSYESLTNEVLLLSTKHQNASITPIASRPTGSYTYNGVALFSETTSEDLEVITATTNVMSDIVISANFSQNTIDGQLRNFVNIVDERHTGSIPFNGTITNTGFTAFGSGTLVYIDGTSYFNTASLEGEFYGSNGQASAGTITGFTGGFSYNSIFIAER